MFDVRAYTRSAAGPYPVQPGTELSPLTHRALGLIGADLATTNSWLARVLVTPTHKDARITAFLSTWAYEQHWLATSLVELGVAPLGSRAARFRVGPLVESLLANVHGRALIAVQMTERLRDSLLLDAMLTQLQAEVVPTVVNEQLAHIRAVLARQRQFFAETAQLELAATRGARHLTRARLRRHRPPLTLAGHGREQLTVLRELGITGERARAINVQLAALPGLRGLRAVPRLG